MLFTTFIPQSWKDYKRGWVALPSSHTQRLLHRVLSWLGLSYGVALCQSQG